MMGGSKKRKKNSSWKLNHALWGKGKEEEQQLLRMDGFMIIKFLGKDKQENEPDACFSVRDVSECTNN